MSGKNFIVDEIKNRILNKNKNWVAIICGETGSGKSYCALKLGEMIDPDFSIEKVIFTPEDFMKLINSNKLKRGDCIIWDEIGAKGMPAREWYSITNKAINYILQTFRRENLAVIFTTPSFNFVDSQARQLIHTYIETQSINRTEQYVIVKFMNMQNSPRFDKIYFKYPRIVRGDKIVTIDRLHIHKPSKKIIEQYEIKKKEFTEKLKQEVEEDILKEKSKHNKIPIDVTQIVKDVVKRKDYFTTEYNKRKSIDRDLIMGEFNVGEPTADKIKKLVEKQIKIR